MNFLPGVTEYEVEAEYLHEFVHRGSRSLPTPISERGQRPAPLHREQRGLPGRRRAIDGRQRRVRQLRQRHDQCLRCPAASPTASACTTPSSACDAASCCARASASTSTTSRWAAHDRAAPRARARQARRRQAEPRPAYKKYFMHGTSHFVDWTSTMWACTSPSAPATCSPSSPASTSSKWPGHPTRERHCRHRERIRRPDGRHPAGCRGHRTP